jgi:hypothetical protein
VSGFDIGRSLTEQSSDEVPGEIPNDALPHSWQTPVTPKVTQIDFILTLDDCECEELDEKDAFLYRDRFRSFYRTTVHPLRHPTYRS